MHFNQEVNRVHVFPSMTLTKKINIVWFPIFKPFNYFYPNTERLTFLTTRRGLAFILGLGVVSSMNEMKIGN